MVADGTNRHTRLCDRDRERLLAVPGQHRPGGLERLPGGAAEQPRSDPGAACQQDEPARHGHRDQPSSGRESQLRLGASNVALSRSKAP